MSDDAATIMMVTYNRLELTKEAVKCILKNTKHPFYLCVVDNGSEDGTREWLTNEADDSLLKEIVKPTNSCLGLSTKLNPENRGIAIGRNQALVLANKINTKWLATIDNDVWVPEGWLTECIKVLQANREFASIGVNMEPTRYPMLTKNGVSFQNKVQGNLGTACMVFNRSLHKMLGFFNYKDYGKYGEEDADWGMRTRVVGFKLGYIGQDGKHLGEGENDVGEYREFKTASHQKNLAVFNRNCREYIHRKKSIYISFSDE